MRDIELLGKHECTLLVIISGVLIILGFVLSFLGYAIFIVIFLVAILIAAYMFFALALRDITKKVEEYDPTEEPGITRIKDLESEKSLQKEKT